jgi:dimethylamine monooxygenase subunit A
MQLPMVFLDGPWRMAMGLNALDPADWLWFDEHLDAELAEKRRLLAERPDEVYAAPTGTEPAAAETLELLLEHLPRHHPQLFGALEDGLLVRRTGQRVTRDAAEPLLDAGLLVQEDLCLMAPGPGGSYTLAGASLCFPMRWRLAEKLGRPLGEIHGPVPGFNERLGSPADRFFAALEPARPVWRANWSLTDDPALHQPEGRTRQVELDPDTAGRRLFVRIERQTLRRLPRSRHVLFTIRTLVRPLDELARLEGVAPAMAARIREMPEPMLRYKNLLGMRDPLLAWLDARAGLWAEERATLGG